MCGILLTGLNSYIMITRAPGDYKFCTLLPTPFSVHPRYIAHQRTILSVANVKQKQYWPPDSLVSARAAVQLGQAHRLIAYVVRRLGVVKMSLLMRLGKGD